MFSPAGAYLAAVDRFGSFGYSTAELAAAPEEVRTVTDETLGAIVTPTLEPEPGGAVSCSGSGPVELHGRTLLRSRDGRHGQVAPFRRCTGGHGGEARAGPASRRSSLPADSADQPWMASIAAGDLERCEPRL